MLSKNNDSKDLLNDIYKGKLYDELILQLNKDFSLVGLDCHFSKDELPFQLKEKLDKTIRNLIKTDFNVYLSLLYRIDVSEDNITTSNTDNLASYSEKVSFEILKRIWKKVWFRSHFS